MFQGNYNYNYNDKIFDNDQKITKFKYLIMTGCKHKNQFQKSGSFNSSNTSQKFDHW